MTNTKICYNLYDKWLHFEHFKITQNQIVNPILCPNCEKTYIFILFTKKYMSYYKIMSIAQIRK